MLFVFTDRRRGGVKAGDLAIEASGQDYRRSCRGGHETVATEHGARGRATEPRGAAGYSISCREAAATHDEGLGTESRMGGGHAQQALEGAM